MPQFETSTYFTQIVWLLLCFFSLWFVMSWFIIPKIEDIIEQRRRKIDGYIQKAEKINKQALSSLEKYETALKKAKEEASGAIADNNAALNAELTERRAENQRLLAQKIAENEDVLNRQRTETLALSDDIALTLALDIVHKAGFADVSADQLKPYADKE